MSRMAGAQKEPARDLAEQYATALEEYLSGGGEGALRRAYEIGRAAMGNGMGVLEMASLHHPALEKVLVSGTLRPEGVADTIAKAAEFFAESLSPYEMTHRGFQEAIAAWHHLNETLEQEINRIAHTVQDEAGQLLVVVHLALADVVRDLPASLQGRFENITALLERVEEQLQRLSHELRPTMLDELGLVPTLQSLAGGISKRANLPIHVHASIKGRLPAVVATTLYRIIQEALANATRHSQAKSITIQLDAMGKYLECSVRDDGIGFDVPAVLAAKGERGLGLIGVKERLNAMGGILRIHSSPGKGTELLITLPWEP